jgi:short-subunit dehydrogenase
LPEILNTGNMEKKVIIITGASSGIGKETALFLVKHNCTVYGMARRTDKLKELELHGVRTLTVDITDETSVTGAISKIIESEGRIDVLINNAGYGEYGAIEDVSIENAKKQMDVNLFGLARITRQVLPHMRRQKSGRIINISSIGGKMTTPMGGWYYASKFAVEGLSDSLRMEVKQFGIDVVLVEPGSIKSEWTGIAMNIMKQASQKSPYAHFAEKAAALASYAEKSPEPVVIARLIQKIIAAKSPKARYSKGFLAKPLLFLKKYLSDAMFDTIILSRFK